jgi:hypothetical protein
VHFVFYWRYIQYPGHFGFFHEIQIDSHDRTEILLQKLLKLVLKPIAFTLYCIIQSINLLWSYFFNHRWQTTMITTHLKWCLTLMVCTGLS